MFKNRKQQKQETEMYRQSIKKDIKRAQQATQAVTDVLEKDSITFKIYRASRAKT